MPPIVADDHVRGPNDAALTIVQYGDYDCPHTRASASILRELEAVLQASLRFVFRHFPLRHLHDNAQILSEIAEAAGELGRFWEVHDLLMGHGRAITQRDVLRDLETVGIELAVLERLLGSPRVRERIERDVRAGSASGVHSTPTWYFNGVLWDGHYDIATFLERARAALSPHRKEAGLTLT